MTVVELYMRNSWWSGLFQTAASPENVPLSAIVLRVFSAFGFDANVVGWVWVCVYSVAIFVVACVWETVAEYWWHRMQVIRARSSTVARSPCVCLACRAACQHLPWFYRNMHKLHHYYKSPQPFDDMMIHPLEGFGYYLILFSSWESLV
jgi:sterol desaturase/sphingolipid hydroxylase (fatty acid hydroxylase superfamily)